MYGNLMDVGAVVRMTRLVPRLSWQPMRKGSTRSPAPAPCAKSPRSTAAGFGDARSGAIDVVAPRRPNGTLLEAATTLFF